MKYKYLPLDYLHGPYTILQPFHPDINRIIYLKTHTQFLTRGVQPDGRSNGEKNGKKVDKESQGDQKK